MESWNKVPGVDRNLAFKEQEPLFIRSQYTSDIGLDETNR